MLATLAAAGVVPPEEPAGANVLLPPPQESTDTHRAAHSPRRQARPAAVCAHRAIGAVAHVGAGVTFNAVVQSISVNPLC